MLSRVMCRCYYTLLCVLPLTAIAAPVTFDLTGNLNGAAVNGVITVDDQTVLVTNWQISVAEGPTDNGNNTLSQVVFSDEEGSSALSTVSSTSLREFSTPNPFAPPNTNDNRDFRIAAGAGGFLEFPATGGQVNITDCWNCSPFRTGTATLVPRAPSPGTLEFSVTQVSEVETGQSGQVRDVQIDLRRIGGSAGTVSVTVAEGSPGDATPDVDYVAFQPTVVTWAAGDFADKQVTVTFLDDFLDEEDESFELVLSNATGGAAVGNNAFVTVIIENDDFSAQPALIGFAQSTASIAENLGSIDIEIEYDPNGLPVSQIEVDVATVANTATEGDDYVATTTTLTFQFDLGSATVSVPIVDDAFAEGAENFQLELSNPRGTDANGTPLGLSQIELTIDTIVVDIVDDELVVAPTIDAASFCTGANGFEFDIVVSGTTSTDFAFRFSADNDAFSSPTERFEVNFDPSGTITRGVSPSVTSSGSLEFDRWQDGPTQAFSLVPLGNNSYRLAGVLAPGADPFTAQEVVSQIGLRTFSTSNLTALSNGTAITQCAGGAPIGTLDFDSASLNIDENTANGSLSFTINRTAGSSGTIDVTVSSNAGTATENTDYAAVNELVSWADGDTTPKTIVVNAGITDDADAEPDETFFLVLSNPTNDAVLGTTTEQLITIVDNDGTGPDAGPDVQTDGPIGEDVQITFTVDGVFPITISADVGAVTPATLAQTGDVTYTVRVPVGTLSGSTIDDTISLTDANNDTSFKAVSINVIASALGAPRNLSDIANLSPNQRQMAQALDGLCPRLDSASELDEDQSDLLSKCVSLRDDATSNQQAINGLDALLPEELTVLATSALRLTAFQHGNLEERINGLRSGATGIDLAGLDIEIQGQRIPGTVVAEIFENIIGGAAGTDDFDRWGLFADGKIKWGKKDETDYESAFDFDVVSLTLGADYRIRDNFVVGGALSWGYIEADFDNGAEFEIESWNASAFGTYFSEGFYVDALLTYGQNDYDTERRIFYTDFAGTVDANALGSTDGDQFSVGISGGFDFNRGPFTFGPHLGLYRLELDVDSFVENGARGLNMAIGDQSAQSFTINTGLHASYVFTPNWGVLIPHLRVDSVFELEDNAEQVTVGFAADPFRQDPTGATPQVRLRTDQADPQYYILNTGVSAQFVQGISGFVNYQYTSALKNWSVEDTTWGLRWERSF